MAVFNTREYVDAAVRSVLRQDFRDFELVIVDDGSTDGCADVLRSLAAEDARIRLVSRPNKGLIATRNELLSLAQADLVAWMDSDDLAVPGRLSAQWQRFESEPGLVCLGGAALCIDPDGYPLAVERFVLGHDEIVRGQAEGGAMRFPTTMMRREAALRVGGFREPFRLGEDLDLFCRLSEAGRMANLPEVLLEYRQHPRSASAVLAPQWEAYRQVILALAQERREGRPDRLQRGETVTVPVVRAVADDLPDDIDLRWARRALEQGYWRTAWKYGTAALRRKPWSLSSWKLFTRITFSQLPRGK
jgi:glycosyltransferase involved in cell wall biosynthesis